jgi:hypothetical protein
MAWIVASHIVNVLVAAVVGIRDGAYPVPWRNLGSSALHAISPSQT